jgi:transposase
MAKGKELTPRQQEIKALTEQGKSAVQIAKKLGISDNGVYQHLRAIRGGAKKSSGSTSRSSARASGGRQSARRRTRTRTAASRPAPTPAAPATAEELLRQEIDGAQAGVSDLKGQIKGHQDEIARAEKEIEALTAEIDRKGDVLAVLTGKKVARDKPKPTAAKPKRSSGAKAASGQSGAGKGAQAASGSQAPSQAPSNGGAASTPAPATQAEREATADHDGPAPAEQPQEAAPATA